MPPSISKTPFAAPPCVVVAGRFPALRPPSTPLPSVLIHGRVLVLWAMLFAMAFRYTGVLAWSTGLACVAYDTLLLGFVFWQTRSLVRRPAAVSASVGQSAARATLGVVVAAHNEAAVLPLTPAALLGQLKAPDQIVVADDGSSDDTLGVMGRLCGLTSPALGAMSPASPSHPTLRWSRLLHGGKATPLSANTVLTVDGVIGAKIALDPRAALVEPFTFQTLRHRGAAWGSFLTGGRYWGRQSRGRLLPPA